ncbi:hypothetical protein D1007_04818 [Hordeum vulgare]|nr:hypothetical protein D1007_04818 [Hordeum vulgare]
MSNSAPKKGQLNGARVGSDICDGNIEALRHRRMLPPAILVAARVPGAEAAPTPAEGELVAFEEHFYRGFGLPVGDFFARFLNFFGLQLYHLVPNAILQLASFIVLYEGFLGIEPRLDLWQKLFFFKQQSAKMDKAAVPKLKDLRPMTPCGAALVHHHMSSGFPQMPLQDPSRCGRGVVLREEHRSLPRLHQPVPLHHRSCDGEDELEGDVPEAHRRGGADMRPPRQLKIRGLVGRDLLATMISRQILPLQRWPHVICEMGDRHDPCRLSTKNFQPSAVARNVNSISSANMDDRGDWEWGMPPTTEPIQL